MKKLRKIWTDLLSLLYQWLATILMWFSIASNFSHIQWYIEQSATKTDWSTWAMAIVVEAGLALSIHQFISSLRSSLMSRGRISKQDKRFNIATLPIFFIFAASLGIFSAVCNTAFFKGDIALGSIAPALTGAFAILEATKELLEERRGETKKETKPKQKEQTVQTPQTTIKTEPCMYCGHPLRVGMDGTTKKAWAGHKRACPKFVKLEEGDF